MAGFRKAKAAQAALKMGLYGLAGSGKTFTTLLFTEGLAKLAGKRVAFVDTERGTDFYVEAVKERQVHPQAFDLVDTIYTRSITEILTECKALSTDVYCAVVVDSITHVWESAIAAYSGKQTSVGTIPMQAWGKIKKPYKELMQFLLSSPLHVFLCGRQGNEWGENEEGELKKVGVKMKAEGETPYEPHILLRMEVERGKDGVGVVTAFAEKDRTGVLSGKTFVRPTFDSMIKPLLPLLGMTQAPVQSEAEVAVQDSEAIAQEQAAREAFSKDTLRKFSAKFDLAATEEEVKAVGALITPKIKADMMPSDVDELREKFLEAEKRVSVGRKA